MHLERERLRGELGITVLALLEQLKNCWSRTIGLNCLRATEREGKALFKYVGLFARNEILPMWIQSSATIRSSRSCSADLQESRRVANSRYR